MLETFTLDTFQPHVGELFHIVVNEDNRVPTKLTEVHRWGPGAAAGSDRVPFSLVFHTVPQIPVLPQQIYRVESQVMDAMELFLAPVGPDERGMRYEALFT